MNLVSLSKVKRFVYCEMCDRTYNFILRKNRARTMTIGFCSVLYGVEFSSKPGFWIDLILVGLGSFLYLVCVRIHEGLVYDCTSGVELISESADA